MSLTAAQIQRAEWRDRRGDHWSRRWTRTVGSGALDSGTLRVQIRAGATEDAPLVATSTTPAPPGVAQITLDGTDFEANPAVFAWQVAADQSAIVPAGEYVIEAECEVDGALRTLLSHAWGVDPQVVH